MVSHKRILSIAVVLAFGVASALAGQTSSAPKTAAPKSSSKTSAPKAHVADGSVVSATNDALTLRSGKKDMTFKLDSTTQKPSTMTPGNNVKVSYHDEGTQHIASSIELVPTKSNAAAAKSPAKK